MIVFDQVQVQVRVDSDMVPRDDRDGKKTIAKTIVCKAGTKKWPRQSKACCRQLSLPLLSAQPYISHEV